MATAAEKKAAQEAVDAKKGEDATTVTPTPTTDGDGQPSRTAEGTPAVVGAEGGVLEEGTGDFAHDEAEEVEAEEGDLVNDGKERVAVASDGHKFLVPVGVDGENPVSPNNPPAKAIVA